MSEKMQHCFYCGEELGVYRHHPNDIEHCGSRECAREAMAAHRQERDEAHERLDRDMGWE